MILKEDNLRKIISELLLESEAASSVDIEQATIDAGKDVFDGIRVDDPKNPNQQFVLTTIDGIVSIFAKTPDGKELEIVPSSGQFHNALGAIIRGVTKGKKRRTGKLLLSYLKDMYRDVEDKGGIDVLLRRYSQLGDFNLEDM